MQERARGAMGHQSPSCRYHQRRQTRGTVGVDGLHALYGCALRGSLSGVVLLYDSRWRGSSLKGPLHRLRILLLRMSVWRAAISQGRKLRLARQDGQMHVLRRRPRGGRLRGRVREIWDQSSRRRQAAAVRGNVLDQVIARWRRRDYRADLQRPCGQARLRLRCLGLADRLSRDHRDVMLASHGTRRTAMPSVFTRIRFAAGALALAWIVALSLPANA